MSSHFSANQYENAFKAKKLKNWTVPRTYKEHPDMLDGFTQIVANDRGHLKKNVPRSSESPWGTFMGTWDMPRSIPPARPSYTARSQRAAENLKMFKGTSSLNEAVNGYKPFLNGKKKSKLPLERPKTPSPPVSSRSPQNLGSRGKSSPPAEESAPQPSGAIMNPRLGKTPSPRATPRGSAKSSPRVSPAPSGTPVRMMNDEEILSPPPSVKSARLPATPDSGFPRSREVTPQRHSVDVC